MVGISDRSSDKNCSFENLKNTYIEPLFTSIFKVNSLNQSSMLSNKKPLDIPNIIKYVNRFSTTHKEARKTRTDAWVRRIAYKLKYKEVNDFSYEEVFFKMVFQTENISYKPRERIPFWTHRKKIPNKILIPKDFYHDNHFYIYNFE